jgi:hypothetical protein
MPLTKDTGPLIMLRQLYLFFFISVLSFTAYAEEDIRYYDVEFILFEHIETGNRQSEDWKARRLPHESEEPEPSHDLGIPFKLEKDSPYDPKAMFTVLPDSQKKLLKEARLLEKSQTRRILSHIAWRQPGLAKDKAIWVNFKNMVDSKKILTPDNQAGSIDFLTGEKQFSPYIQGKVKVILARYLHVDTDILYFAQPLPQSDVSTVDLDYAGIPEATTQVNMNEPEVFLLKQLRRRIRSKEMHYLDHPVMGMLLLITPYEKPEQAKQATKTSVR